jgi:CheY-like chemotaxis protein
LLGDALRLNQVLLNLVGNALKFTSAGSITVRARLLEDRPGDILARLEVTDTGIGIEPDVQHRLFTPFEQADGSMTRQYGGTGLGLAISKRLVELMGGAIGVDSVPGQGSSFWFTVRLKKQATGTTAGIKAAGGDAETRIRRDFPGVRILLVEDEPINREVAQGLLEETGLAVDVAADGAEALACAQRQRYALILMDMQMPRLNGIEATRAIRADSLNRDTPIIAMTANAYDEDRQACLAAGMNDHLGKPVAPDRLMGALVRWLEQSAAR